jgi:hypothetical protein
MAEELFEKQRVAGCTFDTALGDALVRGQELLGQEARLIRGQRAEIDCRQWGIADFRLPCPSQRIAFDPRGHDQHCRALRDSGNQRGQVGQRWAVRPVEIFDNEETWMPPIRLLNYLANNPLQAALPRSLVHCIVNLAQSCWLCQVEQIVEEDGVIHRDGMGRDCRRRLGFSLPTRNIQIEQAAR